MNTDPPATKRQRKLLRFFGKLPSTELTVYGAADLIDGVMTNPVNRNQWNRYKFLTQDFGRDSDQLLPFAEDALAAVVVPEGWDGKAEIGAVDEAFVEDLVRRLGPFDIPPADVQFPNRRFMFTGKFAFGSRAKCRRAVEALAGLAPDTGEVSAAFDYLVVGAAGSAAWSGGDYGNKIAAAVMFRQKYGRPSIVPEAQWTSAMSGTSHK